MSVCMGKIIRTLVLQKMCKYLNCILKILFLFHIIDKVYKLLQVKTSLIWKSHLEKFTSKNAFKGDILFVYSIHGEE